ncbi:SRPBCC family protein [Streptomyces sp. Tu 4128]|uniref:SRPBCC family protein n=1 Tax=Streptomyces sp. Tu 4128 TaxID=1120314 RepID=UPI000F044072|nr:SRPBCC family protein [Streptomyces sp. Tu 4128]
MASLTIHAEGPIDADTAWQRYARLDAWASWAPQIRRVHADRRLLVPGLTGQVESVAGIRVPFRVEAVDDVRRTWSWRVRVGPVGIRLHHRVHAREGGCRTDLTMNGPGLVPAAYAPLARFALRRLVRR